jgi:hypothetical protein
MEQGKKQHKGMKLQRVLREQKGQALHHPPMRRHAPLLEWLISSRRDW